MPEGKHKLKTSVSETMCFVKIFFVSVIAVLITSCGGTPTDSAPIVYVCGDTHTVETNKDFACYWKNGVKIDLGEAVHNSQARGIVVTDSDVYAVGYYSDNGHTIACYWKNGAKTDLEETTKDSRANAVYHDGVHLYVAGFRASNGNNRAVLWVDGEAVELGPLKSESTVNGIAVSDNRVYAAGVMNGNPVYFKYDLAARSVETNIVSSDPGELAGIVVHGPDVYASGFVADAGIGDLTAAYWKNGAVTTISSPPSVSVGFGVAVDGTDVYVTGMSSDYNDQEPKPVYWKNGTPTPLSTPQSNDRGPGVQIAVVDGSVYVAGLYLDDMNGNSTYRIPAYWKDGVRTDLMPAGSLGSAVGMFIQRRL